MQRRLVAEDLVRTVATLLTDGTEIDATGGPRPVRPSDIAVLTRSNVDAADLASRLNAAGVPAATASSQSVLETEAARQWQVLLRALERPGSAGAARAAALGWFVGRTVEEIAAFDDDAVGELHDLLVAWSQALAAGGLPRLLALAGRRVSTSGSSPVPAGSGCSPTSITWPSCCRRSPAAHASAPPPSSPHCSRCAIPRARKRWPRVPRPPHRPR